MKKYIFLIFGIIFFIHSISFSTFCLSKSKNTDKDTVFSKIKSIYKNAQSIYIEFSDNVTPNKYYKLKTMKGNKYSLIGNNRKIFCDGKTLWNYNAIDKNVIISNFDGDMTSFTLDCFFFKVLPNLIPTYLTTKNKNYILELQNNNNFFDIKTVKLILSKDLKTIKNIEVNSNNGSFFWHIKKINTKIKFKAKEFEFVIPKNTEIIDYR